MQKTDIIVIGAGIAGASAAAELAAQASVTLLEMEPQPGYHATGRSAAFFAAAYGNRIIRDITGVCERFFLQPPEGFSEVDLIRLRDCMFLLSPDYLHGAMWDRMGGDIDVDALLQAYLRLLRRRGGTNLNDHRVSALQWAGGAWRVSAGGAEFQAPVVVNAAGAWADQMAQLAGLVPIGVKPLLRTAFLIDPPAGVDIENWPLMLDADEDFYFKPDAGQIMICPADETPTEPCDAQADDLEVIMGVDRFEKATGLDIRHVNHRWAGLRTFAPDKVFVAGFDPRAEGFFWLAGQGGYGVQSAPAMAHLANWLITGKQAPVDFSKAIGYADMLAPDRLLPPA